MASRPGFFKFFMPSLGEENLKIPSRFLQSVEGTWQMNLALRDRYNNIWNVKVEMVGGDWYFKDGWTKFAEDNMIRGGNLLVYEYFSQGLLDFKVHGSSACLTKGAGGQITTNTEEQYIEIESDDDVVGHIDENDNDPTDKEENWLDGCYEVEQVMDDDTDNNDRDSTTEEENRWDVRYQVDKLMDDTDDDHSVSRIEEEDQRFNIFEAEEVTDDDTDDHDRFPTTEEANQPEASQGMQVMNVDQGLAQQEAPSDINPQQEQVRDGTASSSKPKARRYYDWYGAEIFKTGLIPQPMNPYFVTKKRKHRAGELYIPMDVIRAYDLKLPETALLLDPRGRQFHATRKVWADERTFYVGGWKALCAVNMVQEEDSCICEFLHNGDDLSIRVSFFPPKEQQQ